MDLENFDRLTREFVSSRSRRGFLGGLAALLASVSLGPDPAVAQSEDGDAAASRDRQRDAGATRQGRQRRCLKDGARCTRNSGGKGDNCQRYCSGSSERRPNGGGRCACRVEATSCQENRQCCSKQCFENVCLDCATGETACPSAGCVDLQINQANCGTCGTACTGFQICELGVCVALPPCSEGGPCIVFASRPAFQGNLSGVAGGDARCQQYADIEDLPSTYRAWLSDANGASPATRFSRATGPYLLVDGTKVADNWDDLTSGTLRAPINRDEQGGVSGLRAWSATKPDGTYIGGDPNVNACGNWAIPGTSGRYGSAEETDGRWSDTDQLQSCFTATPLYCFQQP